MPGHAPSFVSASLWQIPQACTLMRTSPALGLGISRSTISKSAPALGTCATFIGATPTLVVAINPPMNFSDCSKALTATGEPVEHGSPYLYPPPRKVISRATGAPSGRLTTPYTKRLGFLCFPRLGL